MRDRSMRSGTELAREIKLIDWSMAGNLSNRSSGVQIPCDICTRLRRYLYSAKCSWIIKADIHIKDWKNRFPIHHAAATGRTEDVLFLLQNCSCLNSKTRVIRHGRRV